MVHAQDSPGDDLASVFLIFSAGTIPDWANGNVARVCQVGTELKTVNDAGAQTAPQLTVQKKKRTEGA